MASILGNLAAASRQAASTVFMNPVTRFIGRTGMEMAQRLIPQGAAEMASAIHTGNAFVQYGPTEQQRGSVHGAPQTQPAQAVQTQPAPPQKPQNVMPHLELLEKAAARPQQQSNTKAHQH